MKIIKFVPEYHLGKHEIENKGQKLPNHMYTSHVDMCVS
jgi:hypothetical protein